MEDKMIRKEIGERIKALRERREETQTKLAEAINANQNSISRIENGKMALTLDNLSLIAKHYEVSINYLCTGFKDNDIISILNRYITLEYGNLSEGVEFFSYPILKIDNAFFEYLILNAYANKIPYFSSHLKEQWIEDIEKTFRTHINDNTLQTYINFVPLFQNLLYPDDKKKTWAQTDLLRELDNQFKNCLEKASKKISN